MVKMTERLQEELIEAASEWWEEYREAHYDSIAVYESIGEIGGGPDQNRFLVNLDRRDWNTGWDGVAELVFEVTETINVDGDPEYEMWCRNIR